MAFDLSTVAASGAAAFISYMVATVQSGLSADGRYSKRVDARLQELEEKVLQCEAERPVIAILKIGVCMMATELVAVDRHNPILKQVAAAFATLPQDGSMDELMRKLEDVPSVEPQKEVAK